MINPRFSIIMLVYNTPENYLKVAVDSILNQTNKNYELIIIDDGTKREETLKTIEQYKDNAIIKHQENMGMPASRIEGLKIASGDYVIFVDSDDYLNPDTLNIYKNIIESHNSDIVMHDFVKFSGSFDNILAHSHYFNKGEVDKKEVIKQLCLLHTNGTCGRAVKRELFEGMEHNIDRRLAVGEDVQQSTHVILNANTFYYTDEKIYFYRIIQEHREYYGIDKIDDFNFLTPVYNQIFVKHSEYNKYLSVFKNSAMNSVVYNSFRICLFAENKEQKRELLNKLSSIEINTIIKSIREKGSFVSETLYFIFSHKLFLSLNILSKVYDSIYKMQKL